MTKPTPSKFTDKSAEKEPRHLPLWAYMPTLTAERENAITEVLEGAAHPSSALLFTEACQMVHSAREALQVLAGCSSEEWQWRANMRHSAWSESERAQLTGEFLPPLRYWVELRLVDSSVEEREFSLSMTPTELRLITQLDPDIGRRIGDELDGVRPS